MSKKIYLTESELRKLIGRVIKEQFAEPRELSPKRQQDILRQRQNNPPIKNANMWSDVYNTASTTISDLYNTVSTAFSDVSKRIWDYVARIKKLAIIFPDMTDEKERIIASYMHKYLPIFANQAGWTSYVLDSLKGYHKLVHTLSSKGVKLDQLIIGSHGDGKHLLMTGDDGVANADFLSSIKNIITNQTIIYFTACYGADSLRLLYDAACKTNTTVYASTGVNYFSFGSEKGFYSCSPKPLLPEDRKQYDDWDYAKKAKGGEGAYNKLLIRGGYCKPVDRPPYWFVVPGAMGGIVKPIAKALGYEH